MSLGPTHESIAPAAPRTAKQLRAERRRLLRGASLMEELAWWASPDRRGQMPAGSIASEVRRVQRSIAHLVAMVPSGTWFDDARYLRRDQGASFPPVGMVLSVAEVSWGEGGPKGRRWTPAYCVEVEDRLDQGRAGFFPSSMGSVVREQELRRGFVQPLPED